MSKPTSPSPPTETIEDADPYQLLVTSLTDIVLFMIDPIGTVLTWSPAGERITGFSVADIHGRSLWLLFSSEDSCNGKAERVLQQALTEPRCEIEIPCSRKDGTTYEAILTVQSLYDSCRRHLGYSVALRDLTEPRQRELERSRRTEAALQACEARYRTVFEYAQVGIVLADSESYYLDANATACRLLGYTRDEFIGLNASDIVVPDEALHIGPALGEITGHTDHRREWQFRRKDGSIFSADVVATLMPDGTLLGMIRDLSDAKKAHDYHQHLAAIVESSRDAIYSTDLNSVITSWNTGAEAILGYRSEEMLGTPLTRIFPDDLLNEEHHILEQMRRGEPVALLETQRQTRDGRRIDVAVTISPIRDAVGRIVGTSRVVRDITVQKESLREIDRLSRLYAALSQINQAIVWSPTRDELFHKVCRALVEQGGFQMTWVGWHDSESSRLVPVAVWGDEHGYLSTAPVYANERPEGSGPSGTAFRTGRPCVLNDLRLAPDIWPWRAALERLGFRASAAFPIRLNGEVCGTLCVHGDQPNYFHDREIALLEEAAADLSFALDNFAKDEARRRAEQTLRDEKQFSDTMIESMPGILYFYDSTGRFLRWNQNFETVSGYSRDEIAQMHPLDFFTGKDRTRVEQRIAEVFKRGESFLEAVFVAKDGTTTPYFFTGRRVLYEGRSCLVGVGIDISDRRRAEDRLAENERKYRELVENANSIILRWNADGVITFLNEFGQRFFGYRAEELIGRHVIGTIVPPTESAGRDLRRLMDDICSEPEAFEQNVNENMRCGGERVWIAWTNRIVRDSQGRVLEILSIGTDITARRRAEAALREAELRFHTLFELTPVGVVVIDPATATFIDCNRQAAQQLGYTTDEFCRLSVSHIEAIDTREDIQRRIQKMTKECLVTFETRHRTRSGEFRDVFVSGQLIELAGRTVIHAVFFDITDRKLAEARIRDSEAHLIEAQRIARIGSWDLDIWSNRLRWSDQIYEIFEIDRAEFDSTYESFLSFVHPDDRKRLQAAQAAALAGQARLDIEHRIVLKDGREKVVHELADLKRDAADLPIVLAGTVHDITDRVRIEAEREKRHRAEEADRIKSAFLATMSHELRTPLNSIIGFTGIILQGLAGPLNPEQTKQLSMVRTSARHLLALVNDVLDISKIEAGQLQVAQLPFDPRRSLDKVLALVKPQAEAKGLSLRVQVARDLGTAVGDERRFEQILLNLLSNAIKFTDRGEVALTATRVVDYRPSGSGMPQSAVRLEVADSGMGIKPEDLQTLFQPFRQIDSGLSRSHEGTGLGLAICRRLADLMGGEIIAESEWGKGSTFTVTLPLQGRKNS